MIDSSAPWVSVGAVPGSVGVSQARVPAAGAPAPVNGWGYGGLPYGGYVATENRSLTIPGGFVAECGPAERNLGFSFDKVENGPAESFNFAMCVTEVQPGSWAERSGIEAGCIILRVNGEDVSAMSTEQLREKLQYTRPFSLFLQRPGVGWAPAVERNMQDDEEGDFTATAKKIHQDYVADVSVSKALVQLAPSVMNMFPLAFLLFSLALFVLPSYLVWYVGEDVNARMWFPHITRLVLILPAVYIITYIAHVIKRAPSRFFVSVSLIGSCVMLLVISDLILLEAYEKGPMFASENDCMSWGEKREMQNQWELARTYYANCMDQMAKEEKIPFASAVADLRIQDCPNYANISAVHPDWAYLESMETTQFCGGWCTASPPLWTKTKVQDACAPVVSEIINDKIVWSLKQVCVYAVFALLVTAALLITLPALLQKYGIQW